LMWQFMGVVGAYHAGTYTGLPPPPWLSLPSVGRHPVIYPQAQVSAAGHVVHLSG
jgi:hypothetical protein